MQQLELTTMCWSPSTSQLHGEQGWLEGKIANTYPCYWNKINGWNSLHYPQFIAVLVFGFLAISSHCITPSVQVPVA